MTLRIATFAAIAFAVVAAALTSTASITSTFAPFVIADSACCCCLAGSCAAFS